MQGLRRLLKLLETVEGDEDGVLADDPADAG
jgi:hypothetical protein